MSLDGPRLTTWALQQVVSFLGYNGRAANVAATAESDPIRTSTERKIASLKATTRQR
jgi:Tfp pilus assembly major pilin PilA